MVPMLAEAWPSRCQICRVNAATEVLPLVPVTAAIVAGCRAYNFAAASASARRGFFVETNGTDNAVGGARSPATATAPLAIAASMKRAPSVLLPASAKNSSPGLTMRLSTARPPIAIASACGPIVASSSKRSRSFILFQSDRRTSLCADSADSKVNGAYGLLRCPGCRKNEAVGRRQIESRFDPQKRRNAGNHVAAGRHRVPAGSNETVSFLQRLRLVQHDQKLVFGTVGRQDRGERGEHALLGIMSVDDLLGGAGLAADIVAGDIRLPRRADLGIEPHQEAHLLRRFRLDHALGNLHGFLLGALHEGRWNQIATVDQRIDPHHGL